MNLYVFTTFKCNLHCPFCSLWKLDRQNIGKDMTPKELRKYLPPANKVSYKVNNLVILGGEPFIRTDLVDVTKAFIEKYNTGTLKHPSLPIWFITNGQMPNVVEKVLKKLKGYYRPSFLHACVSVDGNKKMHDKFRGKGAFDRAMDTIERLLKMRLWINISFTISPKNYCYIYDVYQLSKDMSDKYKKKESENPASFRIQLAHGLDYQPFTRYQLRVVEEQLKRVREEEEIRMLERLKSYEDIPLFDRLTNSFQCGFPEIYDTTAHDWYLENMMKVYRTEKRSIPCYAGMKFMILDPYGNLYPCFESYWNKKNKKIKYGNPDLCVGNIRTNTVEELEKRRMELLIKIKPWKCNRCWNECDVVW